MENCKQCKKPLIQTPGRREKEFCNSSCRSKFFYHNKTKDALSEPKVELKPAEIPKTNTTTKTVPPVPVRGAKESAIDFAARKNEWKRKWA